MALAGQEEGEHDLPPSQVISWYLDGVDGPAGEVTMAGEKGDGQDMLMETFVYRYFPFLPPLKRKTKQNSKKVTSATIHNPVRDYEQNKATGTYM